MNSSGVQNFLTYWFRERQNVDTFQMTIEAITYLVYIKYSKTFRKISYVSLVNNDRLHISLWFSLWCLTPLSTIFQLYLGGGNKSNQTCRKSMINFNTMLYRVHLTMNRVRTHNLVVLGTDCTGSCKSQQPPYLSIWKT